jgi:thymidine phosphorylase
VEEGEPIAILYSGKESGFKAAKDRLLSATRIGQTPPPETPLVLAVVE